MNTPFGVEDKDKVFTAYFKAENTTMLVMGTVRDVRGGYLIPDFSMSPFEIRSFFRQRDDPPGVTRARISPPQGGLVVQRCEFFTVEEEEDTADSWIEIEDFVHDDITFAWQAVGFKLLPYDLLSVPLTLHRLGRTESAKFAVAGICITSDRVIRLFPRGSASAFDYHVRALVRTEADRPLMGAFQLQVRSMTVNGGDSQFPVVASIARS